MIFDVNAWVGTWPFRSLRDNTPEALTARLDRSGIDMAAVSSIEAILHRNVQPANERLAEAIRPFADRLVGLATINPRYVKWEDDLAACHEQLGLRGVRLIPQYHGYAVDGAEAVSVVRACAERGLSVSIPQRIEDPRQRHHLDPGQTLDLARIANLIAAVPEATVLVLNARGIARSALWQRKALRERPWYVDLSIAEVHYQLHTNVANKSDLLELIEQGGAEHLIFGTHLPFSYAAPALVKQATLPLDEQALAAISYQRAARIFGVAKEAAHGA